MRYINEFRDRHGKLRRYFRRPGGTAIPLPGEPQSDEFVRAYARALDLGTRKKKARVRGQNGRIPSGPLVGVYLLFLGDELIYVGSSKNMPERAATHRRNGRPFDRAYFIPTEDDEREHLERLLIRIWRPSQNRLGT